MRVLKKCVSTITAAALLLTALPANGLTTVYADEAGNAVAADETVSLSFNDASVFHDTNGDDLGEFEGWGTSLCWWANRLGYDQTLTDAATSAFFGSDGLNMNIGRYNVGGGDLVGEVPKVQPNDKAVIYDLSGFAKGSEDSNPGYDGIEGDKATLTELKDAAYSESDADFGFTKGDKVGELDYIGWINELGEAAGAGSNLLYNVNVQETGAYTIKMLWELEGTNGRAVAIRVNDEEKYVIDYETVNEGLIASGNKHLLLKVTFTDVSLKAGDNDILIGGDSENCNDSSKDSWAPNFIKMLVVKSGEEGVVPETPEFLHSEHIQRSDSAIPGYWKDVTKMDFTQKTLEEYQEEYDRADETSGYAWNYDWEADQRQWNVLQTAMKIHEGTDFIAEAFSNSPPYFMTNSGCSSGAVDSSKDNLREDCYQAFASYMADVIVHWAEVKASGADDGVYFQSTTPMNEPYTNYWGANSPKQEGCHFDQGDSESNMIVAFYNELQAQAAAMEEGSAKEAVKNIIISGTDETSIDTQIDSYNKLSDEAKGIITRIDTHTYGGSKRTQLKELAKSEGKNLWMSEIDGSNLEGTNAGEMAPGLGLAQRIMTDLNGLKSSAWILWNAIDINIDSTNEFDANSLEELKTKLNDDGTIMYDPDRFDELGYGFWGIAIADHDQKELILTRKYYAYGQFSRYIRPGYTILESDNDKSVAAFDPEGKKAVIVALNTSNEDKTWKFDLNHFASVGSNITAIRTSGTTENGENWKDVTAEAAILANTAEKYFTSTLKGNSITTFIIEDVTIDQDSIHQDKLKEEIKNEIVQNLQLEKIELDETMVTGSTPWNNGSDVATNVVDGNFSTFFDGVAEGWVQIDLGWGEKVGAVGYAPRSGYADRAVGASFYGSNDEGEDKNWTRLYTIDDTPAANVITKQMVDYDALGKSFHYIRYAVPSGNQYACNIAEIEVYRLAEGTELHVPETVEDWLTYCQENIDPDADYSKVKYAVYEAAAAEAANLKDSTDEAAQLKAVNALLDAYFALKKSSSAEDPKEQEISVPQTSYIKTEGDAAFHLNAAVTTGDGALSYVSSNPAVAEVSADGQVTVKAAGIAEITVTAAATSEYSEKTVKITITVRQKQTESPKPDDGKNELVPTNADQKISVSKVSYTKAYGSKAFSLNAKVTTGTGALSYASSDKKVVTVSNAGKVTIKGVGCAVVTVTAAAAPGYNKAAVKVSITVNPKKATLVSATSKSSKKLTVNWKKDAKATGYEVQACLKKTFKSGVIKAAIKKTKTTSTILKKLKKGKKYYVRVRAYTTVKVNGKSTKLYGAWSTAKRSGKVK